jgi:hypothetical protein
MRSRAPDPSTVATVPSVMSRLLLISVNENLDPRLAGPDRRRQERRGQWRQGMQLGATRMPALGPQVAVQRPEQWSVAPSLATILRSCAQRDPTGQGAPHASTRRERQPIIARLARGIDGKAGRRLLAEQRQLRTWLAERRVGLPTAEDRVAAALAEARNRGIDPE